MSALVFLAMAANLPVLLLGLVRLFARRGRTILVALGIQTAIVAVTFLAYLPERGDGAIELAMYFGLGLFILIAAAVIGGTIRLIRGAPAASAGQSPTSHNGATPPITEQP